MVQLRVMVLPLVNVGVIHPMLLRLTETCTVIVVVESVMVEGVIVTVVPELLSGRQCGRSRSAGYNRLPATLVGRKCCRVADLVGTSEFDRAKQHREHDRHNDRKLHSRGTTSRLKLRFAVNLAFHGIRSSTKIENSLGQNNWQGIGQFLKRSCQAG